MAAEPGFAYLFERFPAFSQTFCFREVAEVLRRHIPAQVYAIRQTEGEPGQDFPSEVIGVTQYLPDSFESILKIDVKFRRRARRALGAMKKLWGSESEKYRIYEAEWLAPRLLEQGVGHVHAHFAGLGARTAFWMKRLYGIRYSFTAHANDIFTDDAAVYVRHLVREAELVVTETDFSASFLRENYPLEAQKVERVYNGMEFGAEAPKTPEAGTPLILTVGRYIEKKGFEYLIEACAKLPTRDFRCLIVGQGPREEALRQQVEALGLSHQIEITGPKSQSEIACLLKKASVFVLPCVNEGCGGSDNLPTVIMEAMGAGLPVISTRVAGIPEMVLDGQTGLLVPEKDTEALSVALSSLLTNPAEAVEMGRRGRQHALAHFDVAQTTSHLLELLKKHGAFHPVSTSTHLAARFKSRFAL